MPGSRLQRLVLETRDTKLPLLLFTSVCPLMDPRRPPKARVARSSRDSHLDRRSSRKQPPSRRGLFGVPGGSFSFPLTSFLVSGGDRGPVPRGFSADTETVFS